MKIEKAFELLSLKPITGDKALDKDMADAMRLGVEALSRILQMREPGDTIADYLLPGETKD